MRGIWKRGDRGEEVELLQRALASSGHNPGAIDGVFGLETELAVRGFQQARGLLTDGVVGIKTWSALLGNPSPFRVAMAHQAAEDAIDTFLPAGTAIGPLTGRPMYTPETDYHTYGRDERRYGKRATIAALIKIAEEWRRRHPFSPRVGIGPISRRGGGGLPSHAGHRMGIEVDIRPMRNDPREEGTNCTDVLHPRLRADPSYDQNRTRELIEVIRDNSNVDLILFNDGDLRNENREEGLGVRVVPFCRGSLHHHNHLHVRFAY